MHEWRMMSMGEVIDKLFILKVKCEKFANDRDKYRMVKSQHDFILNGVEKYSELTLTENKDKLRLSAIMWELHGNHRIQWDAEDAVFSATNEIDGVRAAKLSRKYNKRRAELKKEIDVIFGEKFLEVKDYAEAKDL